MSKKGRLLFRIIENHPNDSRVKFREDDTFQTLSGRMGTGGWKRTYGFTRIDDNR